jgi:spermidine/putrescine-binding protein
MKKRISLSTIVSALIGIGLLNSCSLQTTQVPTTPVEQQETEPAESENVLNLHNWTDYMDETILTNFEERYGITVNYTTYEDMDALIQELESGPVDYDLVVPTGYAVEYLRNQSFFGPLDKSIL